MCLSKYQSIFKRYEQKYLLSGDQYLSLRALIDTHMEHDEYWKSTIMNIYFDTPNFYLIRQSLEKPIYKEKLRLRSYGVAAPDSRAFVEIKKKYNGVVYKRRIGMKYTQAIDYLCHNAPPPKETQITHEVDYFKSYYAGLAPAMLVCYDREALYCANDPNLRITFDSNITWRTERLDLTLPPDGNALLEEGSYLMEIKIPGAIPLWLSGILDQVHCYPTSYSKYGNGYRTWARSQSHITNGDQYHVRQYIS